MKKIAIEGFNPFIILGYEGADFFCDREDEVERLYRNMKRNNYLSCLQSFPNQMASRVKYYIIIYQQYNITQNA